MSDTSTDKGVDGTVDAGRRDFLRKASYTAPVLLTLGFAAHSRQANAQFPPPPSAPEPDSVKPQPTEEELILQELDNRD